MCFFRPSISINLTLSLPQGGTGSIRVHPNGTNDILHRHDIDGGKIYRRREEETRDGTRICSLLVCPLNLTTVYSTVVQANYPGQLGMFPDYHNFNVSGSDLLVPPMLRPCSFLFKQLTW